MQGVFVGFEDTGWGLSQKPVGGSGGISLWQFVLSFNSLNSVYFEMIIERLEH